MDEELVMQNGRVMLAAAVINDAAEGEPLWDRMSMKDSPWAVQYQEKLEKMINNHADLFDFEKLKPPFEINGKPFEISIELTDHTPIRQRAWRLSPEKEAALDKHLDKLLAAGVIYPVHDSDYSAVCVLVKKPGRTNELRTTTDYRRLNSKVRKYAYMAPTAQENFNMTEGATMYSCVDIHSAFYACSVKREHQKYLAFSTHRGMFTYGRMPQGFANSPSWLASGLTQLLMTPYTGPGPPEVRNKPCLGNICTCFVDDVCIFSKEDKYHMHYLEFIFNLMEKANLSLRPDKCQIGRREVEYLGVVMSAKGMRISPNKVKALHEAPRPKDAAGVRRFLGQANFHRAWIPNFAMHSEHITANLKKDVKFEWDDRHDKEYDYILKHISSESSLVPFSFSRDVYLRCDASSKGYGCKLFQLYDGVERAVHYASKRLTSTEAKRPARDLEAGCICFGLLKFRPLCIHRKIFIIGDHKPLLWLDKYSGNNRRLFNYAMILSEFDFDFQWKPGETCLQDADHLSRHPGPLRPNDPHDPDAGIDANCGTDLIKNPIGVGWNEYKVTGAVKVNTITPTTVIIHRRGADGKREVLTGVDAQRRPGTIRGLEGTKGDAERIYEVIQRLSESAIGAPLRNLKMNQWPTEILDETVAGEQTSTNVCLVDANELSAPLDELNKPIPVRRDLHLQKLRWRKVDDLLQQYNLSDSLRWACQQRLAEEVVDQYQRPKQVQPPYFAPFYGRDVLCDCTEQCCSQSQAHHKWAQCGFQCRKPYLWASGPNNPDREAALSGTTSPVIPVATPPAPKLKARFNVVALGDDVGLSTMALADAEAYKVTEATAADTTIAQLYAQRTGIKVLPSWQQWLKERNNDEPNEPVDLLTVNTRLPGDPEDKDPGMLDSIDAIVQATAPDMVVLYVTPPTHPTQSEDGNQYYALERKVHGLGYDVDAQMIRATEMGSAVEATGYYLVASRRGTSEGHMFTWPEERATFPGLRDMLIDDADRRLFKPTFKHQQSEDKDEFAPKRVGIIQGGERRGTVVDVSHPLPKIERGYDVLTHVNGGGFVVEGSGARIVTQPEQMRMLGFSERAMEQLGDQDKEMVQSVLANTPSVTVHQSILGAVSKVLEAARTHRPKTEWGEGPAETKTCNHCRPSAEQWRNGAIAAGLCNVAINGVLQHTVMPSFKEIRKAQQQDPRLKQVYDYVKTVTEMGTERVAGVKDNKEERVRKEMLHGDYRKYADYLHISNGTLMYRDILNDEWLTDAVVLPESMVETAMEAFHDSGYGAHLGAQKTEYAMRERVWFPELKKRVRLYCDKCGGCKVSKAFLRRHAGAMKSRLYWDSFEDVAVDLQGPYMESADGNVYHMHMICMATRWNVSVPLPNKEAATVAAAIHKHWIISGPCTTPKRLVSDQGSEFQAAVTQELCKQFGIRHLRSGVASPTSNSYCERQHRTYNQIMRTFLHKYGKDWDEAAAYACYAINTHIITGTNVTPYELVFGRKPEDPNSLAVQDEELWGVKADRRYLSPAEFSRLRRGRMHEVKEQVLMENMEASRRNQTTLKRIQYSHRYCVGDCVLRWTANPKIGVYGKLAYKCTGPYLIVGIHDRNPDVYRLVPLTQPNSDPTSHHSRGLIPYISAEHHEVQKEIDSSQDATAMLEISVGDHLLLPQGSKDVLCKVRTVESAYVTVQYYQRYPDATKTDKPSDLNHLELVWWRQNPAKTEEDIEKVLTPYLTSKQTQVGFEPWQEKLHINLFYQRIIQESDLKIGKKGLEVRPLRLAAIRKSKPMVPQSDAVNSKTAVEVAMDEEPAKPKKDQAKLIVRTEKEPKAAHIRRRVKLLDGKTVDKVIGMQVPNLRGDMVPYKKSDFKYDVKAGFLRF